MTPLQIRPFEPEDEPVVVALWHDCNLVVPWNDPHRDIQLKLTFQPDLFLVGTLDGEIVATIMAGYEGHRGWLNYLAVSTRHRHQGHGRAIVEAAIERLAELGCPKVNLQIRGTNTEVIRFYERIGFKTDDVLSMSKRL